MAKGPQKAAIVAALRERLQADLKAATASQRDAHEAATHEEAKPESDKDTRATEASYLARGLARRVEELTSAISVVHHLDMKRFDDDTPIGAAALVTARDSEDKTLHYFVVPVGGGLKLDVGGSQVTIVTPASPLGEAMCGRLVGDEFSVRTPGGVRTLEIETVA